nr:hypothetical protein [Tanacetum cinerariifolium]
MEEDSIDYPDEPEDDDEDLKEDPEENHTDYPADGGDGDDEPSDDDDDDDDTNNEDEEPTEDEDDNKEDEEHLAPTDSSAVTVVDPVTSSGDTEASETDEARNTVRLEPPMLASIEARIAEHAAAPIPPPPRHRGARISDEDTREPSEGSDETEPFEEDETAVTPPPPKHHGARTSGRPQTPMAASTQALIDAFATRSSPFPLPPTSPAYDQAPLGHRTTMIRRRDDIPEEDMPPRRRFAFTARPPGCDVAESSAAVAARAPRNYCRPADRAGDVGYVRALQASECRMMTFIDEVNLRVIYQAQVRRQESKYFYTQLHDAQTDRRDIRLEFDVVRGQRTAYETELQELIDSMTYFHFLYQIVSSYFVSKQIMYDLISCYDIIMPVTRQGTNDAITPESIQAMIDRVIQRNSTHTQDDASQGAALTWWNGHVRTLGHEAAYAMTCGTLKKKMTHKYYPKELALMCTKFLADETKKVDKCISRLPDNIHRNVMSTTPKTLDETIELANDLMDQKIRTYAERQNENKRKADDTSRNNQQQPHKKQNVARAYTAGPGEKNVYTEDLPLCTKCNYHHTGQCAPKCGKCKRYGHTTTDCRRNGIAQGRAYALGGRDASPNSNVITGRFLLNNRYAKILFDTGADRSFVSTTFSALIDITPTTLENY